MAEEEQRKTLPISCSNYVKALSENMYVADKTLLIKAVIDSGCDVTMFTRPRRFGKSFNLSMLRAFFEKTDQDTSVYFRDKKIWQCGERYTSEQGRYPVIYLDFKDLKGDSWTETFDDIQDCIGDAYLKHKELLTSAHIDQVKDLTYYKSIVYGSAAHRAYKDSLFRLSRMLTDHYGVPPVVLIDEVDTPVQSGYEKGYYDKVHSFMMSFLSKALKGNERNIRYAFLCGVLPVSFADENGGLNNVCTDTLPGCERYGEFFGFTSGETMKMLGYYGLASKYSEVCEWYDGYRFGKAELFNPWSVLMYIAKGVAGEYWGGTSSNQIIRDVLRDTSPVVIENMTALLDGGEISGAVADCIEYDKLKNMLKYDSSYIYNTMLLHSGYLKPVKRDGDGHCTLTIPNMEVYRIYSAEKQALYRTS